MRNFLGLEMHESDELLHWTDNVKDVLKLREAWDKIPKKLWPDVKILMDRAILNAEMEQAERDAGEGL